MSTPFVPALTARARLLLHGLRYAQLFPCAAIDGRLAIAEAIALFDLARSLPHEDPRVVEIGDPLGQGAVAISRGLRGKRNPRLVYVDVGTAAPGAALAQNLRRAHVEEVVEIRRGHDAAAAVAQPIDMLLIDGDDRHVAAAQDFETWAPKVRAGGFLCLHEASEGASAGSSSLVEERVRRDPQWVDCRRVLGLFVARKSAA